MADSKGRRANAEKAWAAREEPVSLWVGSSAVGDAERGREAGGAQAMSTGASHSLTIFIVYLGPYLASIDPAWRKSKHGVKGLCPKETDGLAAAVTAGIFAHCGYTHQRE